MAKKYDFFVNFFHIFRYFTINGVFFVQFEAKSLNISTFFVHFTAASPEPTAR
jgi:hypothetical protein